MNSKNNPLFQLIKNHIIGKINSGEYLTGMKIPSESQLGEQFGASRMTVNRALRELSSEGRIFRKQGKGSFVAPRKKVSALFEIKSIADEIHSRQGKYSCKVHHLCEEKATPVLAEAMQLSPYDTVFHSILIHMDADIPIQLADRYINPAIAPDYLKQDFTTITPNEYLLSLAPVSEVEHVVEALIPEVWIRDLLQINEAEPCLALQRTTWVQNLTATKSTFYYPGSRYKLGGRFTPAPADTIQAY